MRKPRRPKVRIVSVTMPEEMHEAIKARAHAQGSTFSGFVRVQLIKQLQGLLPRDPAA